MSFLDKVPENIVLLEKENSRLSWQKREFYGHECDCEYCDRKGEGSDDDELDKIDKFIRDNETVITRLKAYKKLWEIPTVQPPTNKSNDKEL